MSDIPVGSPPVPPGRHAAPGGWYADPVDPARERYWDGWQWSRQTRVVSSFPGSYPQPQPQPQPSGPPYGYPPAPLPPRAMTPVLTADGVPVAGWWWRVLAVLIDWLIVSVVAAALTFPIYARMARGISDYLAESLRAGQAGLPAPPRPTTTMFLSASDQLVLLVVSVTVDLLFAVVFLRWKAATPGKLVVGLRVVPVDQGRYLGRLGWNVVLVRALVWVLPTASSFLLAFRLLDVLFPLWQPKRQALHDLAARTQVVKRG